jgi:hypothetical protein
MGEELGGAAPIVVVLVLDFGCGWWSVPWPTMTGGRWLGWDLWD